MNARSLKLGWLESWLRRMLRKTLSWALGLPNKPLPTLPLAPRFAVLRLDPRVGNQVLMTPVLASLRSQFPLATIDLYGARAGKDILANLESISAFFAYDKWALFARSGPFATLLRLRRGRYDVCLDASNPTQPSTSHAILARLSGARAVVGSCADGFGAMRSSPVQVEPRGHEIAMRLALLAPFGEGPRSHSTSIIAPKLSHDSDVRGYLAALEGVPTAIVNVGARLSAKQLGAADYAVIANVLAQTGLTPVVTWGPKERRLAESVVALAPTALLAPATGLADLCALVTDAQLVITCDTGPMHVAVALGRPTCGLFVQTDPARYGYTHGPHAAIDTRSKTRGAWLVELRAFIDQRCAQLSAERAAPGRPSRRPPPGMKHWPPSSVVSH